MNSNFFRNSSSFSIFQQYNLFPKINYFELPPHSLWEKISSIDQFSKKPFYPLTLRRLIKTNPKTSDAIIKIADWVRAELTVRFAHRLFDFHHLPFFALAVPHFRQTYEMYIHTFENLLNHRTIKSLSDEQDFVDFIEKEKQLHDQTVNSMAQGVKRLNFISCDIDLNLFLQRFFFFRIGRTILIDHLIAMRNPTDKWIGCIHTECFPAEIIQTVSEQVRISCKDCYGVAPKIQIKGNVYTKFAFLPNHLKLIMMELLKNAFRATVEFNIPKNTNNKQIPLEKLFVNESDLPDIIVEVYKGRNDVVIKISDKGGGISPSHIDKIWDFGYTTVSNNSIDLNSWNFNFQAKMAGYGFGCPLSLVFARYFGGDIKIQSSFGIGTDVYLSLNHIGDKEEALFYEERHEVSKRSKSHGFFKI